MLDKVPMPSRSEDGLPAVLARHGLSGVRLESRPVAGQEFPGPIAAITVKQPGAAPASAIDFDGCLKLGLSLSVGLPVLVALDEKSGYTVLP